jgi:hypothetical protein
LPSNRRRPPLTCENAADRPCVARRRFVWILGGVLNRCYTLECSTTCAPVATHPPRHLAATLRLEPEARPRAERIGEQLANRIRVCAVVSQLVSEPGPSCEFTGCTQAARSTSTPSLRHVRTMAREVPMKSASGSTWPSKTRCSSSATQWGRGQSGSAPSGSWPTRLAGGSSATLSSWAATPARGHPRSRNDTCTPPEQRDHPRRGSRREWFCNRTRAYSSPPPASRPV